MQRFVRTLGLFCLAGCAATVVPRELTDARTAYQHASASRASDLTPAELHRAKEALLRAEESWAGDHESTETCDLSYVAERQAQSAEAIAGMVLAKREKAAADQSADQSIDRSSR